MSHDWQDVDAFKEEYTHPLWRDHGQQAIELGGHGGKIAATTSSGLHSSQGDSDLVVLAGMDFILNFRLIQVRSCLPACPCGEESTRPLAPRRVACVA